MLDFRVFLQKRKEYCFEISSVFSDRQMVHLIHTGYGHELSAVTERCLRPTVKQGWKRAMRPARPETRPARPDWFSSAGLWSFFVGSGGLLNLSGRPGPDFKLMVSYISSIKESNNRYFLCSNSIKNILPYHFSICNIESWHLLQRRKKLCVCSSVISRITIWWEEYKTIKPIKLHDKFFRTNEKEAHI